ncbi:MAG: NAD-dependent epimerase/dehydratase family protein [Thermoplasmata archaeon]|nr:MAG: NAD-dependent epimerase/dehydratase family protein [Thermoplasmata archaeon]
MRSIEGKKVVITGGAGFIGSHLVDRVMKEAGEVWVIDNLSAGKEEFVERWFGDDRFHLARVDVTKLESIMPYMKGADVVFHLAANPDVRTAADNTYAHVEQNILATYNVLEAMRFTEATDIVFTSTSTVYGEATVLPTPEDYGPLKPISVYGASKLASEALISSYVSTFGMSGVLYRFANVVGSRGTHGVIFDFIRKLRANPNELEILGDGKQRKSYVHVKDCVEAMVLAYERTEEPLGIYNIGTAQSTDVITIADLVTEVMGLAGVKYRTTGGVDGGRGWKGDVKVMSLDVDAILSLGWEPKHTSDDAVRATAAALLKEID